MDNNNGADNLRSFLLLLSFKFLGRVENGALMVELIPKYDINYS